MKVWLGQQEFGREEFNHAEGWGNDLESFRIGKGSLCLQMALDRGGVSIYTTALSQA